MAVDRRKPPTVRQLIEDLSTQDPDAEVHFGGLHYYQVRYRGEGVVQFEWDETVWRDPSGRLVIDDPNQVS